MILVGINELKVLLLDFRARSLITFIIALISVRIYALGSVIMVTTGNYYEKKSEK